MGGPQLETSNINLRMAGSSWQEWTAAGIARWWWIDAALATNGRAVANWATVNQFSAHAIFLHCARTLAAEDKKRVI